MHHIVKQLEETGEPSQWVHRQAREIVIDGVRYLADVDTDNVYKLNGISCEYVGRLMLENGISCESVVINGISCESVVSIIGGLGVIDASINETPLER